MTHSPLNCAKRSSNLRRGVRSEQQHPGQQQKQFPSIWSTPLRFPSTGPSDLFQTNFQSSPERSSHKRGNCFHDRKTSRNPVSDWQRQCPAFGELSAAPVSVHTSWMMHFCTVTTSWLLSTRPTPSSMLRSLKFGFCETRLVLDRRSDGCHSSSAP